jgi:hypothetical protein
MATVIIISLVGLSGTSAAQGPTLCEGLKAAIASAPERFVTLKVSEAQLIANVFPAKRIDGAQDCSVSLRHTPRYTCEYMGPKARAKQTQNQYPHYVSRVQGCFPEVKPANSQGQSSSGMAWTYWEVNGARVEVSMTVGTTLSRAADLDNFEYNSLSISVTPRPTRRGH